MHTDPMKRTTPKKLAIRRESLRLLSTSQLEPVEGAALRTHDWCSTESMSKCAGIETVCVERK
jgi:hypothetical protein